MGLFSFANQAKHKAFDYKPRFYDPDKEDLDARMSKYKETDLDDTSKMKHRIKGSFSKPITQVYQTDAYRTAVRKSNKIVLYITLILLAIVVYFLFEYFPKIALSFE